MTIAKAHDYAIDAACLLETCLVRLRETIALDSKRRHEALEAMEETLVTTERLLLAYICQQIDKERSDETTSNDMNLQDSEHVVPLTLSEGIEMFQSVLLEKRQRMMEQWEHCSSRRSVALNEKDVNVSFGTATARNVEPTLTVRERTRDERRAAQLHERHSRNDVANFHHSRSPIDSLLFRLIVILQLSSVRIDDAQSVITGRRRGRDRTDAQSRACSPVRKIEWSCTSTIVCVLGVGSLCMIRSRSSNSFVANAASYGRRSILELSGKVALVAFAGKVLMRQWGNLWTKTKITKSTVDLKEWQHQWLLVQKSGRRRDSFTDAPEKSQRLIEYAMSQSPKLSLWHSEGEIRFLLLKRAMDLLYASVGTAVEATRNTDATRHGRIGWKLPITAAAAASYYSLIDPSQRASEVVSSSAFDLIQYAWGMVSLPAIKQLSLRASRLLKGAAIAERITIAGVPCFILSREPSPDLAAALMRERRKTRNRRQSDLSTIHETTEDEHDLDSPDPTLSTKDKEQPTVRLRRRRTYPKRNIILHFTGGGFFAHTLASDVPFLLDWSGKTNAVVICPEYSLLPEHTYPVALNQVTKVYCSLVCSDGETSDLLGMDVGRVIVTGESTGGNLAAAMCVKLCMDKQYVTGTDVGTMENHLMTANTETSNVLTNDTRDTKTATITLPHAIMLSCPALNLTLDLSPSRVVGQEDPVLPSGLITAISDAYAPPSLGMDKRHALISPLFAPDDVLRLFPPILIFASSNDPLLDDSVDFNRRCCSLGVDSQLGAVSHMPHAYWGLGTAGFPEARQVQEECQEWLVRQFNR